MNIIAALAAVAVVAINAAPGPDCIDLCHPSAGRPLVYRTADRSEWGPLDWAAVWANAVVWGVLFGALAWAWTLACSLERLTPDWRPARGERR